MVPIEKVQDIIDNYSALEKELSSGALDPKLFAKKSKEYSRLGRIILTAREFLNFESEKKDLENMLRDKSNDQEMIDLAQKDLKELEKKLEHIKKPINLSIIGCVVNGPGEAAQTEIGLTGGGQDSNLLYLSGIPHTKVASSKIIDRVVELVEKKIKEKN